MEQLKIALVHMNVIYDQPEINHDELIRLNTQAAAEGAQIIVNTEMATSGYSFHSRDEIANAVQTSTGPAMQALSDIASRYGVYIVFGYAERDDATNIYYNAAAALSSEGKTVCHYRKNSAETRWACTGGPLQDNTFATPWGRVGLLICSDSYFGALPRTTALRGADIILIPANWPAGTLDPAVLWRTRAIENGVYVAACNRAGNDRTMKFDNAWSSVHAPSGEVLLSNRCEDSRVFYTSLPLHEGKLATHRQERLQSRTPELYTSIYLDMRYAEDLTSYYELPKPCPFRITALPQEMTREWIFSSTVIETAIAGLSPQAEDEAQLLVLPAGTAASIAEAETLLANIARSHRVAICAGVMENLKDEKCTTIFADASGHVVRYPESVPGSSSGLFPRPCVIDARAIDTRGDDTHGIRLLLADVEELMHPEMAVAAVKLGCDLTVATTGRKLDESQRLVLAARSIENVYVAIAAGNCAFICEPPESHHAWKEVSTDSGGCSMTLDFTKSRKKRFYDRLDFDLLLNKNTRP